MFLVPWDKECVLLFISTIISDGEEPCDWLSGQIDSFRFLEALASRGIAVKSQVRIVSGSVRYPVS